MKYRVGRKTGLVILTTKDSKEVASCATKEIAREICRLLNKDQKPNVGECLKWLKTKVKEKLSIAIVEFLK